MVIDQEISKLLNMGVIKEVEHDPNEYISPIFVVPKKNGEYRMILNLKELNKSIPYYHFKMETFESALKLVKPNCYFGSVDVRHAYYCVPIAEKSQIKLRFQKSGKVYQYSCVPNGICCAPRWYTKLMKPVYASLRMLGHTNSGYIDDSLLAEESYSECEQNIKDTVSLMTDLGFIIHEKKSVLIPTKKITFLGNDIDSEEMTVTLPEAKKEIIVQECKVLHGKASARIRQVARILGLMVSSFSAVQFGPLFYRCIEREKIFALKCMQGNYDSPMQITDSMKTELKWWIDNLSVQKRNICHGNPNLVITTDASTVGWGAVCDDLKIGGRWTEQESANHINYLELLAASHSLRSFCKFSRDLHVQIKSDNSCTVAYINHMGGIKSEKCNELAKMIWLWCMDRDIWLSATHVPGVDNEADFSSRNFSENVEWKLNEEIFLKISRIWGMPDIDMFASRLNKQVDCFVSWRPDPDAFAVDGFSLNWSNYALIYAFVPFSLIGRTIQKLRQDVAEMVLVAPVWLTQNWYPAVLELLIDNPRIFKVTGNTLTIPQSEKIHPLVNKLHLMACRLSGNPSKRENFRMRLPQSSWRLGDDPLRSNIPPISTGGFSSVIKGKLVDFKPL